MEFCNENEKTPVISSNYTLSKPEPIYFLDFKEKG